MNRHQSTKAERQERRKRMKERERGNRNESDPGNNTGNSLDALLHPFHCLLATRAMLKKKAVAATACKNRVRGRGREERKKAFLLMNKGNFIFCFSLGMVCATLYYAIRYFLLQLATVHN
jgi:hypothetical protein